MSSIVIDKSWLTTTATTKIVELSGNHRLLLPFSLGYELLTASRESHLINGFKKLIAIQKSVDLIDPVGSLLRYEIDNQRSSIPIEDQCYKVEFGFNQNLAERGFLFTEEQKRHIEYCHKEWESEGLDNFKKICIEASGWIPDTQKIKAGSSYDDVQPILKRIASDFTLVKKIYDQCKQDGFPSVVQVDKEWALFRWLQLLLMASVDYVRRYGHSNAGISPTNMANDYIDLQYCATAVLAKALATCDKRMKLYYQLCCPEGMLF